MLKRTITGIILVATLISAFVLAYYVSAVFLDVYILIWVAMAVYEMARCLKNAGYTVHKLPLVFILLACYPLFYTLQLYYGLGLQGIIIVFLCAVALELAMFTLGNQENNRLKDLTANIFILVYPMLALSLAWLLSFKYGALYAVLFAIMIPLAADTFAYFAGSLIGGRKLCPKISPKKTIAGAVGGLIGAMIIAVGFFLFFDYFALLPKCGYVPFIAHTVEGWEWKSALIYLAIGLVGGVVAEIGDLAASRIKRELNIKDYGKIFPGHGGAMDRLDSIISGVLVLLIAFTAIYGY